MVLTVTATMPVLTSTALGGVRNPQFGFMYTQGLDANGNVVAAVSPVTQGNVATNVLLNLTATGTGSNNSPDQTNNYQRGANLFLNISNISATSTVALNVQSKDPQSGNYLTIFRVSLDGLSIASTVGLQQVQVYPGVTSVAQANMFLDNAQLGLTWRGQVSITSIASTSSGNAPNIALTLSGVQLV